MKSLIERFIVVGCHRGVQLCCCLRMQGLEDIPVMETGSEYGIIPDNSIIMGFPDPGSPLPAYRGINMT
jgi:hypothetical protein